LTPSHAATHLAPSASPHAVELPLRPRLAPVSWRADVGRRVRRFIAESAVQVLAGAVWHHPQANPARHGVEVERDIAYGVGHPTWRRLDIYRPIHRPKPWPTVFYVHGGGFNQLSKDTHWIMGLVFARYGYQVINISYRLAPRYPFPAAIEDTSLAYAWMAEHLERLGGDPTRVAVAGESAGANLVTALTTIACQRRPEPWARAVFDAGLVPRASLPFCGILEVTRPERFAERRSIPRWVDGIIRDTSRAYLGGYPSHPTAETELADPLRIIEERALDHARPFDRPLPPFFAPVGTRDPLIDDTRRLEKALRALDVPVEARYYPGGIHAFQALVWDPMARRCWRDALAFLDRHLRAPR
jgi:acetyl esterase